MEKKFQKMYPTCYSLLIVQDLWQAHYQILSIIFLKGFIELNVNTDMMTKKCENCDIKNKYFNSFHESKNFKDDLIEYKCLCWNKNFQDFLMHTDFLIATIIGLFYCCEKVFILMKVWMIGTNSMKNH